MDLSQPFQWFEKIWEWNSRLWSLVASPITVTAGILGWAFTNWDTVIGNAHNSLAAVNAAIPAMSPTSTAATMLAQANRFMPISETFTVLGSLLALRSAMALLRWVKSLIPAVN